MGLWFLLSPLHVAHLGSLLLGVLWSGAWIWAPHWWSCEMEFLLNSFVLLIYKQEQRQCHPSLFYICVLIPCWWKETAWEHNPLFNPHHYYLLFVLWCHWGPQSWTRTLLCLVLYKHKTKRCPQKLTITATRSPSLLRLAPLFTSVQNACKMWWHENNLVRGSGKWVQNRASHGQQQGRFLHTDMSLASSRDSEFLRFAQLVLYTLWADPMALWLVLFTS